MILTLAVLAAVTAATPEDAAINQVYERLAAARRAGDVAGMSRAFAPEAMLVDQRPGPPITGAELAGRLEPMAERLHTENARVETQYRIERRSVVGDLALDAGFMRQTVVRADGQGMTRYARFLVTLRRQADGSWRIVGDASMRAEEAQWNALTRSDALHFDA